MATKNVLKKAACWPGLILFIFAIGSASVSFGDQPAGSIAISPRPAASIHGAKVTASWYGSDHENRRTANGQRFRMHKNTLAHKTLPMGTKVRLINPDNGKIAEGVVNDRGPYVKGRDVDVSFAMARQLGFVKKGVMKLDMEKI
jgi:rare lipoprotein A